MTNTPTTDVKNSLRQCLRLFESGADYVRLSVPDRDSVAALKKIRKELHAAGFQKPLIADIHFRPEIALMAAPLVEKIRINPGNYHRLKPYPKTGRTAMEVEREKQELTQRLSPLLKTCRENGTAVRIGTNMGSLPPGIVDKYGNTPEAMVEATLEFLRVFEELGFCHTVVSLKASNPLLTVRAYQLMAERMRQENMAYPLHLGVTEAGEGKEGRARSAIGIGTLLKMGLGDTIRISLTEDPAAEIAFAKTLLAQFQFCGFRPDKPPDGDQQYLSEAKIFTAPMKENRGSLVFTSPGSFPWKDGTFSILHGFPPEKHFSPLHPGINLVIINSLPSESDVQLLKSVPGLITVADLSGGFNPENLSALHGQLEKNGLPAGLTVKLRVPSTQDIDAGGPGSSGLIAMLAARFGDLLLSRIVTGLWLETGSNRQSEMTEAAAKWLMQAAGLDQGFTEYISCPTCARTSFDLPGLLQSLKKQIPETGGLKIAVMGCIVNGPGEMADADFGIIGTGGDKVAIYQGRNMKSKGLDAGRAAGELLHLLRETGRVK
jgi:(E)-4-hydroxy-3-methylbut-2-enyl-diphosphate synthase